MGIIQREGLKSTVINYLGVGIAYINLIIVLPLFLELNQIGLIRLIMEIAALLAVIFQMGTPYLIIRYFPFYDQADKILRSFFTMALGFSCVGIALLGAFYYLFRSPIIKYFGEKSPEIKDYETIFLLIAVILILFGLLGSIFETRKIIAVPTFLREVLFRISLTFVVVLIGANILSFNNGLWVWTAAYAVSLLLLFYIYKKSFGLRFCLDREVWNFPTIKKLFKYSGIISMGLIGTGLSLRIDMIMTGSLLGLEELGIYGTIVYMATIIEIPKRALGQIAGPFISEYHKRGDIEKIGLLYKKNTITLLIIGFFLFIFIYFNLPYLFKIMPKGDLFEVGLNAFLILGIVKLISLFAGVSDQILLNSKEAWVSSTSIIMLAILSIILNLIFIPKYGIEGAAFATLLAVGINHLLIMTYVYLKFKIHPFSNEILYLFCIALFIFIGGTIIPQVSNPWIGIVLTSIILGTVYPFIVWKLKFSEDANQLVLQIIEKVKSILKL